MEFSIGEVSKLTGLSTHTLRYYEKEGLLYNISRKENGLRSFSKKDIELLDIIACLKDTGMSIAHIKEYIELCKSGADTIETRSEIFKKQRLEIIKQIEVLTKHLETADYKIWYYENVEKLGNEEDPLNCEKMKKTYENIKNEVK